MTIDAGPVVLKRWEPQWAQQGADAVRESLPELQPYLPWATDDYSAEHMGSFIQMSVDNWAKGEQFNYALLDRSDALAGGIGLMTRMGPGTLEIGYWMRTSCAGRGWMTAAVRALADVAVTLPGIDRLTIRHHRANLASAAVAIKAGFAVGPGGDENDVIRERRA
ncbi:GNAT family N-acetyltransferase [Actinoplanes sp. TFC3]|uniref:GNAT family N-acetyltransferase n=1 Tax=Actinoplanes sp. TFC3 TaxID=1710355 RepID=UPI000A519026|nr:GNAT family N-acetyltransferase [Actinoplanes sp. TFC3]